MVEHKKPRRYSDLDKRLHDDFVRMDEEAQKDPYDLPHHQMDRKTDPVDLMIQEANQDGLMFGHLPY